MVVRRAHLVGSMPGADATEAMRLAVDRLGPALAYLPDGETGDRANWIISMIEALRLHPDLELAKEGDWSDYDKTPRLRVRRRHRLYGASLDLGISAAASAAHAGFLTARAGLAARAGLGAQSGPGNGDAALRFQVGIPGDADLALFTFGPSGPLRHRRPFTEALAAAMHQTSALFGDDVVYQIEIPAEVVLLARAPGPSRKALARVLARWVAGVAAGAPVGARFGLHLCLGDLNHRALGHLADASPLVILANAIVARWPQDRPLLFVHLPLAEAEAPPVEVPSFYAPLSGLDLGAGVRVIAGFAHEGQEATTQFRIRDMIERAVGGPVDVSTSCGLGRRPVASATAALDRIRLLLDDHLPE